MITKMPENFKVYQKKPVKIKAIQMDKKFKVKTLEGILIGQAGDYLIEGIKGELYPCKKEIFEETYIEVSENESKTKEVNTR